MGTEATFGLCGKDFVILAADCQAAFSIIRMKDDADKIWQVEDMLIAASGPASDTSNFVEFIEKNIKLHTLKTGLKLSTKAAANFTRNELATSLRKGPFQADLLIAGCDQDGPALYFLDYLASMEKVNKAAHGYGAMFTFGLMDRYYKPDLTLEEAKEIIRMCIRELEQRFIVNLGNYKCKVVTKDGCREEALF
jgi:20S proteasome subunit beta 4